MDPNGLLNGYFYVDCQICISWPLKLYIKEKILMIAIQDKFILIKFSSCIKLHKELGIFCFCESSFSWRRMFTDYASKMANTQTFDNGSEAI